jgi:hypothetical protein
MQHHNRANKKWNINEILSLQREYQLLKMTIDEIAERHKRSAIAIAYKLKQEGFIDSLNDARDYKQMDLSSPPSRATGNWKQPSSVSNKSALENSSLVSRMAAIEVSLEHIILLLGLSTQNNKDNISLNMDNFYEEPY